MLFEEGETRNEGKIMACFRSFFLLQGNKQSSSKEEVRQTPQKVKEKNLSHIDRYVVHR